MNKKIKIIGLREAEASLLEFLLKQHIEEGSYFGVKKYHDKMVSGLYLKIASLLEKPFGKLID